MRKGRSVWYIKYLSSETLDWKSEATVFRIDDPAGKRRAIQHAEAKVLVYDRMGRVRRQESWTHWVPDFLKGRYSSSPLTLKSYEAAWSFLCLFLVEKRVIAPEQLTYNHAMEFLAWRMKVKRSCGKPVSRNTAIGNLKVLGLLMGEAVRRGFALSNPVIKLGLRRDPAKEKVELTAEEVAQIRAAVASREAKLPLAKRWMTVSFEIAYYQGCRLTETRVALGDINESRGEITFHTKGKEDGKKKVLLTALHPKLLPLVAALRAAGATHTCELPRMAAKEWWALRKEIGLGHTCFHSTRVGVVSQLARSGVSEQMAMRYVGHSSRLVHRVYQKLRTEDLGACTRALDFPLAGGTTDGKE
jgi:integrase